MSIVSQTLFNIILLIILTKLQLSNDEIRESQLIYISKPPTDEDPKKARYQILSDTIEKPKEYNERKLTNLQLKLICESLMRELLIFINIIKSR